MHASLPGAATPPVIGAHRRRLLQRFLTAVLLLLSVRPTAVAADCISGQTSPPEFLLEPGAKVLVFGDSITHAASREAYGYSRIVDHVLHQTYCDLAEVRVDAWGRSGSSYRRYPRAMDRRVRRAADSSYGYVLFQDAGRALDASNGRFEAAVRETLDKTLELLPEARILLATTPPLDDDRARLGYRRRYGKSDNFGMNNAVVEGFDGYAGATRIVPWASDACATYAAHPDVKWTRDGVHPTPVGHLLLAISVLEFLGANRSDLDFGGIETLHPDLDAELAGQVADWVYDGAGNCP